MVLTNWKVKESSGLCQFFHENWWSFNVFLISLERRYFSSDLFLSKNRRRRFFGSEFQFRFFKNWKNRSTLCHHGPAIFVLSFPTPPSCSLSPWWWWWSLSSSPLPLAQRSVLELKLDGRLYTFCCRLPVAPPFPLLICCFSPPPLYKLSPHPTASSISFMLFIWLDFITSPIASNPCIRRWYLERLLHYMYLAVSPMPFSLPSFFLGFVWGGREGGVCAPFHHQHSMHILRIVWYWRLFGDIFDGNFFKEGLLVWKPRPLRLWPVGSVFSSLTSLTQVHFSLSYLCVVSGSFSSPACVPVSTNCQYFLFFLDFRMWFRVSIILGGGLVWVQNECYLRSRSLVTLTPFLCSLN